MFIIWRRVWVLNNTVQYNRKPTSGVQIHGKSYDADRNIAYKMTKL